MSAWTPVPKPTESSVISTQGSAEPFGLLIAITSVTGAATASVITGWTDIAKPTSSVWVAVAKPTT
jgi:hypothetical protein